MCVYKYSMDDRDSHSSSPSALEDTVGLLSVVLGTAVDYNVEHYCLDTFEWFEALLDYTCYTARAMEFNMFVPLFTLMALFVRNGE